MSDVSLLPDFLPAITLEQIDAAIPWVNRDGAPRDECFMSTLTNPYTYGSGRGVRTYEPIPYTELVEKIRQEIHERLGTAYEACFSNKYIDQHKHLGWHADDADEIDHEVGIAVVSFGAEREIWFRKNGLDDFDRFALAEAGIKLGGALDTKIRKVSLPHGSLLLMPPGFQQTHQHRIPKHSAACGPRVSLTFRKLRSSK